MNKSKTEQIRKIAPVQIEVKILGSMSLFCKTCNNRRLPKWFKDENATLWLCETCEDFFNDKNEFIRKVE